MSPLPGPDWVYYGTAGVLGVLGSALLWRALFHDRSRGRARCPKCWYDMSGVAHDQEPPFICPECGTSASTRACLARTRRSRVLAAASFLLLLGALVAGTAPRVSRDGVLSVFPRKSLWLLARAAPNLHWKSLDDALAAEALKPNTNDADLVWYARHRGIYHARSVWVRTIPIHVTHSPRLYLPGTGGALSIQPRFDADYEFHPPPLSGESHENWWRRPTTIAARIFSGDSASLDFTLTTPHRAIPFARTITLVDNIDQAMTPVKDQPADIAAALAPRIVLVPPDERAGLILADLPAGAGPPTVFGLRAELVDGTLTGGERVLAIARWHQRPAGRGMLGTPVPIRFGAYNLFTDAPDGNKHTPDLNALAASGAFVRFSTDEEMALSDLTATHYWRGSFTVPLKDLLTPPGSAK